jgi:glutamate-1-semialdehyde 2,1-aminomutase
VPEAIAAQTLVVPYNDRAALEEVFAAHAGRIAAVITEAAAANMGVVAPASGFSSFVADLCRREGALLISDEVLTGFRAARAATRRCSPAGGRRPRPRDLRQGHRRYCRSPRSAAADVMDMLAPPGPCTRPAR